MLPDAISAPGKSALMRCVELKEKRCLREGYALDKILLSDSEWLFSVGNWLPSGALAPPSQGKRGQTTVVHFEYFEAAN